MAIRRRPALRWGFGLLTFVGLLAGCGGPPSYVRTPGLFDGGGRTVTDGNVVEAGSGGGPPSDDAAIISGTGGVIGSGGLGSDGGAIGTGGTPDTGGVPGTGGHIATGGTGLGGAGTAGAAGGSGGSETGGAAAGGRGTAGTGTSTGGVGTGGVGAGGTGAAGANGGTGGSGTGGGAAIDIAKYNFESTAQSWANANGTTTFRSVTQSTAMHFAGRGSLAGTIAETASNLYYVGVTPPTPVIAPGTTITFQVFIPTGSTISWVQPFTQGGSPNFMWTGAAVAIANLNVGEWNTMTLKVPTNADAIARLGVQFNVAAAWAGTVYIDSVNW